MRNLHEFQLKKLGLRAGPSGQSQATQAAQWLYRQTYRSNWLVKIRSLLTRRSGYLLDLAAVRTACLFQDYKNIEARLVPLNQIIGSASTGRCADFDANFRPINPHNEARWLAVAATRYRERRLPPVNLIQVGNAYFVEDGHHRISVAGALGEHEIEALVTVCRWKMGLINSCKSLPASTTDTGCCRAEAA